MMAPRTHATVIRDLGGKARLAEVLGVKRNRLSKWHTRGIPPVFWHLIEDLAAGRGMTVTAECLLRSKPQPQGGAKP